MSENKDKFVDLGYRFSFNPATRELKHAQLVTTVSVPDPLPSLDKLRGMIWTGVSFPTGCYKNLQMLLAYQPPKAVPLTGWRELVFKHTLKTFPDICDPAKLMEAIREVQPSPGGEFYIEHALTKHSWFQTLGIRVSLGEAIDLCILFTLTTSWGCVGQKWSWDLDNGWRS